MSTSGLFPAPIRRSSAYNATSSPLKQYAAYILPSSSLNSKAFSNMRYVNPSLIYAYLLTTSHSVAAPSIPLSISHVNSLLIRFWVPSSAFAL